MPRWGLGGDVYRIPEATPAFPVLFLPPQLPLLWGYTAFTGPLSLPSLPKSWVEGALAGPSLPTASVRQACSWSCPLQPQAPAEAFSPACSLPGPSVFPPQGRGEACFSSPLRNCASETYNAAVKISGSGWAAAQRAPCSPQTAASSWEPSWERGSGGRVLARWGERMRWGPWASGKLPRLWGILHQGWGQTPGLCSQAG